MKYTFSFRTLLNTVIVFEVLMMFSKCVSADPTGNISFNNESKNSRYKTLREFQFVSYIIKTEGDENKGVITFEGNVELKYNYRINFYADKIVVDYLEGNKINYIEMTGNVLMRKGEVAIMSQKAFSDNFQLYIKFVENVIFSRNGLEVKSKNIKYHFILDKIEEISR